MGHSFIRQTFCRISNLFKKSQYRETPKEGCDVLVSSRTTVSRVVRLAVVFYSLAILFNVTPAFAQSISDVNAPVQQGLQVIQQPLGLPTTDIRVIIARIIRIALGLLGIIFVVLALYGGYLWMTAGGNEEQITAAKKILTNAVIGLIIILSAYGIVTFVMRMLGIGNGGGDNGAGGIGAETNFAGSGGLGQVIKDHYPERNQTNVPRNTKIIITFYKPIQIRSVATSSVPGGDFHNGGCTNVGQSMNWETDCDHLLLDANHINITRTDTGEQIHWANVLASYENNKVYTIVIRPGDYLGSEATNTPYTVHIGNGILVDDPANPNTSIFAGYSQGNDHYDWQFTCGTQLDLTPPHVVKTLPDNAETTVKNTVIQVTFDKAIDPTGLQGSFADDNGYYGIPGNAIFLKSDHSTLPAGEMRLTNGYRTLEFTPSTECGINACGGKIYCLSVCDAAGANCSQDNYQMLLRAGITFNLKSFEAIPFSGVMDVSGNALDGNNNKKVDPVSSTLAVFPDQKVPDNYFWNFVVKDEMDITSPYVTQITPGINGTFVKANDPWIMNFSKPMRIDSVYGVGIEEKATGNVVSDVPLCRVPRVSADSKSVSMSHCPFLDTNKHFYYPIIDSSLEDAHFNCVYPGKGPLGNDNSNTSLVCDESHPNNCCAVTTSTENGMPSCCNGDPSATTTAACIANLKANSI